MNKAIALLLTMFVTTCFNDSYASSTHGSNKQTSMSKKQMKKNGSKVKSSKRGKKVKKPRQARVRPQKAQEIED